MKKDVIVVGSGMGGLCTALVLSKNNLKPVVYEKNSRIGGSFASYNVKNYQVDTGLHLLTRGSSGELPTLLRKYIGPEIFKTDFVPQRDYLFYYNSKMAALPGNLSNLLKFKIIPLSDRLRFARMFINFLNMGREGTSKYAEVPVYEYIKKYVKNDSTLNFFNALCWMSTGTSLKEAALSRFVDTIVRHKKFSMSHFLKLAATRTKSFEGDYYPKGGLKRVPELLIESGKFPVEREKNVEKVVVEDGKVKGVVVNNEFEGANTVVYGGPVNKLPGMIEGGKLARDEVKKYEQTKSYFALTLWLGFNKQLAEWGRDSKINIMEKFNAPHWMLFLTDFNPSLAPKGHQLMGVSTILHKDKKTQVEELRATVEEFIPNYKKHLAMEHVQVQMAEKCLQTSNKSYWWLPDQKTSIQGLYIVGTDTKGWGNGGTLCADSAMRCVKHITQ